MKTQLEGEALARATVLCGMYPHIFTLERNELHFPDYPASRLRQCMNWIRDGKGHFLTFLERSTNEQKASPR